MCYFKNKVNSPGATSISACLIIGFILIVSGACQDKESSTGLYYPVDSLIRAQIVTLVQQKARLEKTAILKGEESKIDFIPDSLEWVKEFEVFNSLNVINKPVYKGLYTVSELKGVGLLQRELSTREPDLPVQRFSLTYHSSGLQRLEAQFRESNSMYEGTRHLVMEFEDFKGKQILTRYSIDGDQKMFLSDSVNYKVEARVSYRE